VPAGSEAGLDPVVSLINARQLTNTANLWGVDNNSIGTSTNRIVVYTRRWNSERSFGRNRTLVR